jgi:hypothetical protein
MRPTTAASASESWGSTTVWGSDGSMLPQSGSVTSAIVGPPDLGLRLPDKGNNILHGEVATLICAVLKDREARARADMSSKPISYIPHAQTGFQDPNFFMND